MDNRQNYLLGFAAHPLAVATAPWPQQAPPQRIWQLLLPQTLSAGPTPAPPQGPGEGAKTCHTRASKEDRCIVGRPKAERKRKDTKKT